jgi:hypothetical protein
MITPKVPASSYYCMLLMTLIRPRRGIQARHESAMCFGTHRNGGAVQKNVRPRHDWRVQNEVTAVLADKFRGSFDQFLQLRLDFVLARHAYVKLNGHCCRADRAS